MRIAQLIDSLAWGGAQKLLVTFAEAARQRDITLTVISLNDRDGGAPFRTDLERLGVRVVTFHGSRLVSPSRFFKLRQFLQQEQFDIVHTHLSYANILGSLACTLSRTPIVATMHNVQIGTKPPLHVRFEQWLLQKTVNHLIVVGQQVAKIRRPQFPSKTIHIVPNAVTPIAPLPTAKRLALRQDLIGNEDRPLLINVGRLTYQKGLGDLLTAFAQVCQSHPQAALIIVGGGEILPDLAEQIKQLGLENNAWLLGKRSDVPQLLGASDLYVSSAYWEGLPVAMLEAMSAGLPVVATAVGDVPVVMTEQTGLTLPPKEPEQLAQAICQLLDDKERLSIMGAAAREHVTLHYSPSVWLDKLLTVYAAVQPNKMAAVFSEA